MFLKGVFSKITNSFFRTTSNRKSNCSYDVDDVCYYDGALNWCKLRCVVPGISDSGNPDFSSIIEKDGDKITDGTVVWVVEDLRLGGGQGSGSGGSKVTTTLNNETKFYLAGPSEDSSGGELFFDDGVYVSDKEGELVINNLMTLESTTPAILNRITSINQGTKPSVNQGVWPLQIVDSSKNVLGGIYKQVTNGNVSGTYLYDYANNKVGGNGHCIGVTHNSSGTVITYAPTPSTSDNSTQIATTAYVRSVATSIANTAVSNHTRTYRHYSCSSCGTSG